MYISYVYADIYNIFLLTDTRFRVRCPFTEPRGNTLLRALRNVLRQQRSHALTPFGTLIANVVRVYKVRSASSPTLFIT